MTKEMAINILRGDVLGTDEQTHEAVFMAIKALKEQARADAVEVVRCKDCIYSCPFDEEELKDPLRVGEWHCEFWYAEMHDDDYCSCGERREDGKIN